MNRKKTLTMTTMGVVAAFALAACGSSDSYGGGSDQVDTGAGGDGNSAAAAMDPSTIKTGDTSLGNVLVDNKGRSVYLFTEDGQNTNAMQCDAACLKLWPPVEGKPKAGAGLDASKISTTRARGVTQATYAGHPLYYYAEDAAAGDVKGQGIDKIWYVLDSSGKAIMKAADSGATSGGGDDYGSGGGASGGY